jgi:hypothetical protein
MSQIDRTDGLVGNTGYKAPVKAATTGNITLSAAQTIDGVAVTTGDRVLVKDQTSSVNNGIYDVDTGSWERAADFDGAYDVVEGSFVYVVPGGTANGGSEWRVSTTGSITPGTTAITFARQSSQAYAVRSSAIATAGQTLFNLSTTYQSGGGGLAVYVNGFRQRITDDYTETSSMSITFTYALAAGDEVDCYSGIAMGSLTAAAASAVSLTDAGDFYVGTTVEAVLQELGNGIAADNGDANVTLTYNSSDTVQRWNSPLSANRTATLSTANAKEGSNFTVVRGSGATGNYTLSVGSLATLRAPGEWATVRYDLGTTAWILEAHGYLPTAGPVHVGSDVGDASATLLVASFSTTQRWATALTADRTATLSATGAWAGARFRIKREETATGAFSLIVTGAAQLIRLAPGQWCDVEYTGTAWIVTGFGDTRPGLTSMMELRDDFLGAEIDGYKWQSLIGTNASTRQAIVLASQTGGAVRMTTGADAGATMALNGAQLHSDLNWTAANGGLVFEAMTKVDAVTAVAIFIGMTDQIAALEMPFTLTAGDVLTSNASNAFGILFDTDATTDNWWLVGVAADVDATKQNTALGPSAATYDTWRIEVDAVGAATFYRNGTAVGTALAGAVTPAAQLTPVIAAFSRGAASRNIDTGAILVRQQR